MADEGGMYDDKATKSQMNDHIVLSSNYDYT